MPTDRELGLTRNIPRRDFLNGVAIGISGAYAAAATRSLGAMQIASPGDYPPALTGLRGNYPAAIEAFGPIAQRRAIGSFPALDVDTRETYDLVIVGAGISGLAAAHFWRRALGSEQKILILDNHDDFGGHAKRNEFTYQGRTFIGYGGTQGIATPYPYSYTAKRLVEELGIQVERNAEFQNREAVQKLNLGPSMFFDKEHFGEDRLVARQRPHAVARVLRQRAAARRRAPRSDPALRQEPRLHGRR